MSFAKVGFCNGTRLMKNFRAAKQRVAVVGFLGSVEKLSVGGLMKKQLFGIYCGILLIFLGSGICSTQAKSDILVPQDYPTIQEAVNAAGPGATIKVAPGLFVEQIVIAKNLTLKGAGMGETIIQAPAVLTPFGIQGTRPVVAIVRITDGAYAKLRGLTVSGPFSCNDIGAGIRVVNRATLELRDSHVTRMWPEAGPCPPGPQRGGGIVLGSPANVQDLQTGLFGSVGHGDIENVTVDQFQGAGITVVAPAGGDPSTARIFENILTGGPSPFFPLVQTGVALSGESISQVKENHVTEISCTAAVCGPNPFTQVQASGISTSRVGAEYESEISENFLSGNFVGIYQFASPDCCSIRENVLKDNLVYGILIQDGDGSASENSIVGGQVGIVVAADFQNTTGILSEDSIENTSVSDVQELECCGFNATAVVQ